MNNDSPDRWKAVPLRSLASKIGSGATPRGGERAYKRSGIPLIRSMNVHYDGFHADGLAYLDEEQAAALNGVTVQGGDVLLNITGASIGRVTQAPQEMNGARVNQHVCIIRPIEGIEPSFLARYLASPSMQAFIAGENYGVTRQALTKEMIENIIFPVPPLEEQRRIVAKLESIFNRSKSAREELSRIRRLIERWREAVFAAASDGDLTSDWRESNADSEDASTLLRGIHISLNTQLQPAKLFPNGKCIPKTWAWCKVGDVGDVTLGRQRSPRHHSGTHMRPYLRVANVFENRIDTRDVMEMNFTPKEYERFKLEPEDILLNEGQSKELIGRPAMFMGELEGVCFTNTLVRFRAYPPISAPYAMLVFRHYFRSGLFQSIANITTNIAHLGAGRFADLPFPLPPLAEQAEIVKRCSVKVRAVEIVGSHVSKALAQIERFEQATLAKAFRGELVGLRKSGGPVPFRNGDASNG